MQYKNNHLEFSWHLRGILRQRGHQREIGVQSSHDDVTMVTINKRVIFAHSNHVTKGNAHVLSIGAPLVAKVWIGHCEVVLGVLLVSGVV